jgi:dipeptidyl aminopeptidase/acylaminoacyl peptidase
MRTVDLLHEICNRRWRKRASDGNNTMYVPSGSDPACTGARPVVLYAHGTTVEKAFNMANVSGYAEATLVAAIYAAQGFIVVAPNYAGYDVSSLSYHPYLNAEQQANDMVDAMRAARKAFPVIGAQDSGKLLIAGYSGWPRCSCNAKSNAIHLFF